MNYVPLQSLAVKWEPLERNPATNQEKFKEPPQRGRYLSEDELPRFLAALDEEEDGLSVAAIRLLLFTGCRRGEILTLKGNEVRLDEDCISLLDTKNGRSRMVHLNAWAKAVVEGLHENRGDEVRTAASEYVFPSWQGTKKRHLFDLRNPFDKACQHAGVENFRIHDLRHTFASIGS